MIYFKIGKSGLPCAVSSIHKNDTPFLALILCNILFVQEDKEKLLTLAEMKADTDFYKFFLADNFTDEITEINVEFIKQISRLHFETGTFIHLSKRF
jgi:hypothetical protein